uniref:Uncharacterized protein n=1 Tax=Caenorhabditis japonica TaxID=281687 RepID=A0A8R1I9R9_CAEJA
MDNQKPVPTCSNAPLLSVFQTAPKSARRTNHAAKTNRLAVTSTLTAPMTIEDKKEPDTKGRSSENRSSGSKELSEQDEKTKVQKIDKDLAQKFFHELQKSRRMAQRMSARISSPERAVKPDPLEVMPESNKLNSSVRAMKKKLEKMKEQKEEPVKDPMAGLFKENGEPVWMVPERSSNVETEDGVLISNIELAKAMAEDDVKLEEKPWADVVNEYIQEEMPCGATLDRKSQRQLDPFAELKELTKNDEFLSDETVRYMTAKTLYETSMEAVNRFDRKRKGLDDEVPRQRPNRASSESTSRKSAESVSQTVDSLKTCYGGITKFDLLRNVFISYDRRNPKKVTNKKKMASSVETATVGSKETS